MSCLLDDVARAWSWSCVVQFQATAPSIVPRRRPRVDVHLDEADVRVLPVLRHPIGRDQLVDHLLPRFLSTPTVGRSTTAELSASSSERRLPPHLLADVLVDCVVVLRPQAATTGTSNRRRRAGRRCAPRPCARRPSAPRARPRRSRCRRRCRSAASTPSSSRNDVAESTTMRPSSTRLVEDRRDVALLEAAQPLHEVARVRRRRDDADRRVVLLEPPPDARSASRRSRGRPRSASSCGRSRDDLGRRRLVVRARVLLVLVLERHEPVGVLGGDLARHLDGAVRARGHPASR